MKKLFSTLLATVVMTSSVFASSYNTLSRNNIVVKDESSIAYVYLQIEPKSEVETGSSIIVTFSNATVFEQSVLDGTCSDQSEYGYNSRGYQYLINGRAWNTNESFYDVMPSLNTAKLPYHIKKINDKQIEIELINLPDVYANNSLYNVNGIGRTPYYSIPLVAYADGLGNLEISIDSNGTTLSEGILGAGSIYGGKTDLDSNTYRHNYSTTTTTESTTETTTTDNIIHNPTSSRTGKSAKITIGSNTINVDGNNVAIDVPAYIQKSSSSTLVPLRAVSEIFGGSSSVVWTANTKTATIAYNGNRVSFTAGSDTMNINGTAQPMGEVKAEITEGRMFVPFRLLGDAMGLEVSWDAATKTAIYSQN